MYRKVVARQRPQFSSVIETIKDEYPTGLRTPNVMVPHVSILSRGLIAAALDLRASQDSKEIIGHQIDMGQSIETRRQVVLGTCTDVDFFGNSLGIVVESDVLSSEIILAYDALFRLARPFTGYDSRPHITIGEVTRFMRRSQLDGLLDVAAEACAESLPDDRTVMLGSISYKVPRITKPQGFS